MASGLLNIEPAGPLVRRKVELELAMREDPANWDLRGSYFELLHELSQSHFGALWAVLPEIGTPLHFRGASSDLLNLRQIFGNGPHAPEPYRYGSYGFDLPRPRRILDLGGYCGYAAVYFANRFPEAKIVTVEPPGSNYEVLRGNTAPYANIRALAAGAWHERTHLRLEGQLFGDWGTYFRANAGASAAESIVAYTIADLLEMHGWGSADLIKCIIEGAQVEVLAASTRPWLQSVGAVITRPVAGQWRPGEYERLVAAYPASDFEQLTIDDVIAFRRRAPQPESVVGPTPVPLVPLSPNMRAFELRNIAHVLSFYRLGDDTLNITPNPAGAPRAGVVLSLALRGHTGFRAHVVAGPAGSAGAKVGLQVQNASRQVLVDDSKELATRQAMEWQVAFPPIDGVCEVLLWGEQLGGGSPSWLRIAGAKFV